LLTMPVIMMSGHATIDTAVEATRIGAINFLEKPITLQRLLKAVQAGLQAGERSLRMAATGAAPAPANTAATAGTRTLTSVSGVGSATGAAAAALSQTAPNAAVVAVPPNSVAVLPGEHMAPSGSIALNQPLREARDE